MKKETKDILLLCLRAAVALSLFVLAIVYYDRLKNIDVRALVARSASLAAAIAAIWGIYLVKSVLFVIPASLIYIYVGMAFEPWVAIAVNCVGILLEVIVTYFLGRFLGGDYVRRLLEKNKAGQKILEKDVGNNFPALLSIRALPVFPIDFVSLFWGASKCRFPRYLAASLIGILPRVVLFTLLGDGIYDYIPIHLIVKIGICAIPVGVAVYVGRFFWKRRQGKQPDEA